MLPDLTAETFTGTTLFGLEDVEEVATTFGTGTGPL